MSNIYNDAYAGTHKRAYLVAQLTAGKGISTCRLPGSLCLRATSREYAEAETLRLAVRVPLFQGQLLRVRTAGAPSS